MFDSLSIAIVGASGIVGKELLLLFQKKQISFSSLFLFASSKKTISIQNHTYSIYPLDISLLQKMDLIFLCAGSSISEKVCTQLSPPTLVVDLSSRYRLEPEVPLILPEINSHLIQPDTRKIASPNCVVSLMLLPLFPLHQAYHIKKILASTYQAASGGGELLVKRLLSETQQYFQKKEVSFPYAFNLYLHNSSLQEGGYVEEEIKIIQETQKILQDPTLPISVTCVRVPVLRAHSISVHTIFAKKPSLSQAYELLSKAPGILLYEDRKKNRFATPLEASYREEVFYARLRIPPHDPYALEMWIVGDQLLKGAALNALQIAQHLVRKSYVLEKKTS